MYVNPFNFGIAVGFVGAIIFELATLIVYAICLNVKKKKGNK